MSKGTLLVVDDDPAVHELMSHLFAPPDYRLFRADDLAGARTLLAAVQPDVAVIDGVLPDGSGVELIEELRAGNRNIQLVFLSAHYRESAVRDKLLGPLEVSLVMHKPVNPAELRVQIDELFASARRVRIGRPSAAAPERSAREVVRAKLDAMRHGYGTKLRERLVRLDRRLRAARRSGESEDVLQESFKEVHNVHGTAGTLNLGPVGAAAAQAEDLLRPVLEKQLPRNDQFWEALFTALGRMQLALDTALGHTTPPTVARPVTLPIAGVVDSALRLLLVTDDDEVAAQVDEWVGRLDALVVRPEGPDAALARAAKERFHGVLLDGEVGTSGDGYRLARAFQTAGHGGVPVAFLGRDYLTTRLAAAHVGSALFLSKPLDEPQLVAAVAEFGRRRRPPTRRLLVLSDDAELLQSVEQRLVPDGAEVSSLSEPWKLFHELRMVHPDVLLVDLALPGVTGLDICRMVRADPEWRRVPILVAASSLAPELRVAAARAGVDGYLQKPLQADALRAQFALQLARRNA